MATSWGGPADVYVVRSAEGEVLYVGMTGDLRARMAVHKASSPWWDETNTMTVETFVRRSAAERQEALLVDQLKPRYNVVNWRIWREREEEIIELSRQGMTYKQIREATGIPANTMHGILTPARRAGLLPPVGPG